MRCVYFRKAVWESRSYLAVDSAGKQECCDKVEVWRVCLIYGLASLFPYSAFGGDFLEGSFAGEGPEEIFVAFSESTSELVGFIGAGSRKVCLLERFGTGKT